MSEIDSKPKNKPMGYVLVLLAVFIPIALFSAINASLGSGTFGENIFGIFVIIFSVFVAGVVINLTTRR